MFRPRSHRFCSRGGRFERHVLRLIATVILAISTRDYSPLVMAQQEPSSPSPTLSLQTLAPFAPIISGVPTSPSVVATPPPSSPTNSPTYPPSISHRPTVFPSSSPTDFPTISHHPTAHPSISSLPTIDMSDYPSISPVYAPSSTPSTDTFISIHRSFQQILQVESSTEFTDVQRKIYQLLMQSYTVDFGHYVSEPLIETVAIVTDQNLAVGRRKNRRRRRRNKKRRHLITNAIETTSSSLRSLLPQSLQLLLPQPRQSEPVPSNLLVISFRMSYSTKFGYEDIDTYPYQFQTFINSNLANVTIDMSERFLPVLDARSVIMYMPISTGAPSPEPSSLPPQYWNGRPTTIVPSVVMPTLAPYPSTPIIEEKANFVVGLAVGLVVAAIVVGGFIGYILMKNRRKEKEQRRLFHGEKEDGGDGKEKLERNDSWRMEEGIEVSAEDVLLSADGGGGDGGEEGMMMNSFGGSERFIVPNEQQQLQQQQYHQQQYQTQQQQQQEQQLQLPPQREDEYDDSIPDANTYHDTSSTRPIIGVDALADSIFSNPSMISGGGSFSSKSIPDDYAEDGAGTDVRVDTLQDEFDNYKNQDLEYMRNGVEESVYGAEGMMSLAMTRALMGEEDADVHPSWGEAEGDPESMAANGLCETNDWLRKNEHSTLDERNQFFQELLNRMVITVRRGLLSPTDGTHTIHCCAAMLGLQLEKELPNNVLLVHGMRKTNDLALGRLYLIEAFSSFGDIEAAAIAPINRGFGFVRFVSPKSVQRALDRFRISEIEVQDVSVNLKSLNDFSPAV